MLNIYSVILIMSLALYPYVYLIVKASFEKSKSALLNPALSLGSSRKKLFLKNHPSSLPDLPLSALLRWS